MDYPTFRFKALNHSQLYDVFVEEVCIGRVRHFRNSYLKRHRWQCMRNNGDFVHVEISTRQRAAEILYDDFSART